MLVMPGSTALRRFAIGFALAAGAAIAPFAVSAASAAPEPAVPPVAVAAVAKPSTVPAAERPVVVIGASISNGYGAGGSAYPQRLGSATGKPVSVHAANGVGYADGGMAMLTRESDLAGKNPSLVVLQAGSNDVGADPARLGGQVSKVVRSVRAQAPNSRIALVTVFPTLHNDAAARSADATIARAARSADPSVTVISPLAEGWKYPVGKSGHPGAGGHAKIADRLSAVGQD
jgi:lysophospholipase L1-like esterase